MTTPRLTATIKWFNYDKGYGFIRQDSGVELFVHQSQLNCDRDVQTGDKVEFEIEQQKKGPVAINVSLV